MSPKTSEKIKILQEADDIYIKELIKNNLPIFVICFGHQILALTLGAKTKKMKLGHREANHPVKNLIKDNVEIGANCTVDKATLGSTLIKKGVKIDNLVQVAHNVEIGESTVIAACVGIAGSTTIGKNCMIGGQAGISGHLKIGDRVMVQAQSGVMKNIPSDTTVMGMPAFNYLDYNKSYVHFKNLPKIMSKLNDLFKKTT